MTAKTIVITGASSGIGAAAARLLAATRPNDRLVLVGRNPERTAAVAGEVGADFFVADYSRLDDVRAVADKLSQLDHIDVLANNAGGMFDGPTTTGDGFELTWQVNTVAPFLLTSLLRDKLAACGASTVQTSSMANVLMSKFDPARPQYQRRWRRDIAYGNAKLAGILMTRFFHAHGLPSVAFHPGVLKTGFSNNSSGWMAKLYDLPVATSVLGKSETGGKNLAFFITGTPGVHFESGEYYNDKRVLGRQKPIAKSQEAAHQVFGDLGRALNVEWAG